MILLRGNRTAMYLRHATVCKDGKRHTYWRLVRSVRRGRRVVQETVAHLGELDGEGRTRARRLALQITGRREQYELFEAAEAGKSQRGQIMFLSLSPWT